MVKYTTAVQKKKKSSRLIKVKATYGNTKGGGKPRGEEKTKNCKNKPQEIQKNEENMKLKNWAPPF